MKSTRAQLVEALAEGLIDLLLDMVEDGASDTIDEALEDEALIWNRLKIEVTPEIAEHERKALAHSVLRKIAHDLAIGPLQDAEEWDDVRKERPRQQILL